MTKPISKVEKRVMEQITDKLTELVGEKYIAEELLDMKYAMEHKEKMDGICDSFTNMTCVVLNTVSKEQNKENQMPTQTHLIFHEKMDADIVMNEAIEHYIFAFQFEELDKLSYINNIIKKKGDLFLNTEEYMGLYDATLME